jgi:hypothetical protein
VGAIGGSGEIPDEIKREIPDEGQEKDEFG